MIANICIDIIFLIPFSLKYIEHGPDGFEEPLTFKCFQGFCGLYFEWSEDPISAASLEGLCHINLILLLWHQTS